MLGTFVNAVAIIIGSGIGVMLKSRFPENIQKIVFQGLGLSTMIIGIQMGLKVENILVLIFSILLGGIIGESMRLDHQMERFGNWLKKVVKSKDKNFTDAFVGASIIFCVGAMAIVGSIDEGLRGDTTVLFTKSILDGFAAIALAASMGIGVAFAVIPILLYQGGMTLLASQMQGFFTPHMIAQLTATGGVLFIAISLNLLEIRKIKTINFLPALFIVVLLSMVIK